MPSLCNSLDIQIVVEKDEVRVRWGGHIGDVVVIAIAVA